MNRSAIWYTADTLQNTWIGFSTCLSASTINATKTYYVGVGADNEFRLVLDGQVIIDTTYGSMPESDKFKYWNVYPVIIPAGNHTLELYGLDFGVVAGFGMEIYDNTLAQLTAATSTSNLNIIWSSSGYTTAEIVQDTSGYYLSSGYTCTYPAVYSVCSGGCIDYVYCDAPGITPTPTHTATATQTPTPTLTPTPTQSKTEVYFNMCASSSADGNGDIQVTVRAVDVSGTSINVDTNVIISFSWEGDLFSVITGTVTISSGSDCNSGTFGGADIGENISIFDFNNPPSPASSATQNYNNDTAESGTCILGC